MWGRLKNYWGQKKKNLCVDFINHHGIVEHGLKTYKLGTGDRIFPSLVDMEIYCVLLAITKVK